MQQGQQSVAKTDGHKGPRVHVETIRKKQGGKVYEQYLLRSSYREGGKVKHRTLGNISHLPLAIIDLLRRALRGEQFLPASDTFKVCRSLPHGHVAAVLGTARRLGLERLLGPRPSPQRSLVLAMVVAPAAPSPEAEHKAQTKRTAQAEPVHSFQALLLDLATIAKNTIVFKACPVPIRRADSDTSFGERSEGTGGQDTQEESVFERITTPTPLQQRAFELLDVALK